MSDTSTEQVEQNYTSAVETLAGDAEPLFGQAELGIDRTGAPLETSLQEKAEATPVEVAPEAPAVEAQEEASPAEATDESPFERYFQTSNSEPVDSELAELVKDGDPEGYSQRVREQVNKRREIEQNYSKLQSEVGSYYNTTQDQINQLKLENAKLLAQMEARASNPNVPNPIDVDPADPVESLRRQFLNEVNTTVDPRIAQLEERLQAYETKAAEQVAQFEAQKRQQEYSLEADRIVQSQLLPELDNDSANRLQPKLKEMVLMTALNHNVDFDAAASMTKDMIMEYARGVIRANSKKSKARVADAQKIPNPVPRRAPGGGTGDPTAAQLAADGRYATYLDWMIAGRPPLKKG